MRRPPLTIEAIQPLKIKTKTLGSVTLNPGERLTWPDEAVRLLLEKVPQKIKVIEEQPDLHAGVRVRYCVPQIESAVHYIWEWYEGTVEMIDHKHHLVLVIPKKELEPWRWVAMTYIKLNEKE